MDIHTRTKTLANCTWLYQKQWNNGVLLFKGGGSTNFNYSLKYIGYEIDFWAVEFRGTTSF